MVDHDNDSTPSNSDQEDLLVESDYEDLTDLEDIQFAYSKATTADLASSAQDITLWKTKLNFVFTSIVLLLSSFLVIILFPLYWEQLEQSAEHVSVYSGLLFVTLITTVSIWILAIINSWVGKWDVRVFRPPFSVYRTILVGSSYGIGGTLITLANSRIPCHLQDPLKALTMLLSLMFYFFLCRKVMGLQRIFSATTSVVGLFIAVDYGLCDEYRCRGYEQGSSELEKENNRGTWHQRIAWTFIYVIGLALWTLHITLLECHIIKKAMNVSVDKPEPPTLLSTVSRLVSHSDPLLPAMTETSPKTLLEKKQTKELHMLAWTHLVAFVIVLVANWIDMLPTKDTFTTPSEFLFKTHRGLSCHFELPKPNMLPQQLEYLSNLTPHGAAYNKTIESMRNKRELITEEDERIRKFQMNYDDYLLRHEYKHHYASLKKHNQKYKSKRTQIKVSKLITKYKDKCELIRFYGWMFTLAYILFCIFTVRFLILSESAVFTISLITMSLPFAGLYWSVFKLVPQGNVALVEWGPMVTGEMICCLLGLPIVMLGTLLLCKAHFKDFKQMNYRSFDSQLA